LPLGVIEIEPYSGSVIIIIIDLLRNFTNPASGEYESSKPDERRKWILKNSQP